MEEKDTSVPCDTIDLENLSSESQTTNDDGGNGSISSKRNILEVKETLNLEETKSTSVKTADSILNRKDQIKNYFSDENKLIDYPEERRDKDSEKSSEILENTEERKEEQYPSLNEFKFTPINELSNDANSDSSIQTTIQIEESSKEKLIITSQDEEKHQKTDDNLEKSPCIIQVTSKEQPSSISNTPDIKISFPVQCDDEETIAKISCNKQDHKSDVLHDTTSEVINNTDGRSRILFERDPNNGNTEQHNLDNLVTNHNVQVDDCGAILNFNMSNHDERPRDRTNAVILNIRTAENSCSLKTVCLLWFSGLFVIFILVVLYLSASNP